MSLSKIQAVDLIEIIENGCVQVRTATKILDDEKVISSAFHRHAIAPGDDYSNEDAKVQSICALIQTPEVIAAYKAAQEAAKAEV